MLALLLAAVVIPPTPTATIVFRNGDTVTVTGQANTAGNADYPWKLVQTLSSPRGAAAAVRFCYEYPNGKFCEVYVARPDMPVMILKNSNVVDLLWTTDSKYLLGAGVNTVRLWNLSGSLRTATPLPPLIEPGVTQAASEVTRLWLDRGDLCVATRDQLFYAPGRQKSRTVTTTRYALPTLKLLTTTNYPAISNKKEAECMQVRRSD